MATAKADAPPREIVIRSWPKMFFLYPSVVVAICMAIAQASTEGLDKLWGGIFLVTWIINLMVLTFEFPRTTSLTAAVSIGFGILLVILLNQRFEFIPALKDWITGLDIRPSTAFYVLFSALSLLLFIGMFVVTRFDYWRLSANELVHHTGILGDVERYSTAGLKFNKEISDIFEYVIAGAGTIVINLPGNQRPVVLENVLQIQKIIDLANRLLEARVVPVERTAAEEVAAPARREDDDIG